MKYFAFSLCMLLAIGNCMASIYDHNLALAGAWASAFFGWSSSMFANFCLDDERKNK